MEAGIVVTDSRGPAVFTNRGIDWRAAGAWRRLTQALAETPPGAVPCRAAADPSRWISDDPRTAAEAAEACRACPLLRECRAHARTSHEAGGIWGGESAASRLDRYKRINRKATS